MQFVVNCEGKTPVDHHQGWPIMLNPRAAAPRPPRSLAEMRIDFWQWVRGLKSMCIDRLGSLWCQKGLPFERPKRVKSRQ